MENNYKGISMKIEIEVSEENEATESPYWLIINPRQNFRKGVEGAHNIASMITGPFFSREEAQRVLEGRSHHYGKDAIVYCHSGYNTIQYSSKVRF